MKRYAVVLSIALVALLAVPLFGQAAVLDPSFLDPVNLAGLSFLPFALGEVDLFTSKKLRESRANLVDTNSKLLEKIGAESDAARRKELEDEWDKRDADIVKLTKDIDRAERQEKLDEEMRQPAMQRRSGRELPSAPQANKEERVKLYKRAFWAQMRGLEITDEERAVLRAGYSKISEKTFIDSDTGEERAMSTTIGAGGYTIPEGFYNELQDNMLAFGGVRPMCTVLTTASGNALPIPTSDDTSQEAQIVGEGSALTSPQDPTFNVVTLNAFMYRTLCLVSLELLQDSAFDLEQWVRNWIATRFARGTNRHFTTGNGSTQPNGFIPASSSGVTLASATSISYADLVDLEHSVDPAYRIGPKVGWQFNDGTLKVLKKLVDGQSRPLWLPGMAVREPDTILGYRYGINQHMAAVAASNKSIAFGDWSKYWIRDVMNILIVRANELHIGNGQIGFYAFARYDGDIIDAGTDPIKHGTHPSPN